MVSNWSNLNRGFGVGRYRIISSRQFPVTHLHTCTLELFLVVHLCIHKYLTSLFHRCIDRFLSSLLAACPLLCPSKPHWTTAHPMVRCSVNWADIAPKPLANQCPVRSVWFVSHHLGVNVLFLSRGIMVLWKYIQEIVSSRCILQILKLTSHGALLCQGQYNRWGSVKDG